MKKVDGIWHIKNNWFLTYFWGLNLYRWVVSKKWYTKPLILCHAIDSKFQPRYPQNVCILIYGLFGPILSSLLSIIILAVHLIFYITIIFLIGYVCWQIGVGVVYLFTNVSAISVNTLGLIALIVIGFAALYGVLYFLFKTNSGQLFRDYVKDKKKGLCRMVVVE